MKLAMNFAIFAGGALKSTVTLVCDAQGPPVDAASKFCRYSCQERLFAITVVLNPAVPFCGGGSRFSYPSFLVVSLNT